jgi:heavy metal efflux system protein
MIHRIVQAALRQRFLVLMLTAFITVGGILSFQRMPVDAYPDLSPPQVEIITQWPDHAAEEVERLVTLPLELEMNGVPHMVVMRSISLYGLSDIILTFEDNTNDYFARQIVFERLAQATLADRRTLQSGAICLARAVWCIAMCSRVPTAARRNSRRSRTG